MPSWGSGELAGKGAPSIGYQTVDLVATFGDYKSDIDGRAWLTIDGLCVRDCPSAVRIDLLGTAHGLCDRHSTNANRAAAVEVAVLVRSGGGQSFRRQLRRVWARCEKAIAAYDVSAGGCAGGALLSLDGVSGQY